MSGTHRVATSHAEIEVTESDGRGPVVLMIHGNSSCKEVFRNQYEGAIGREFRCVAMDLPGHGGSSDASDPERTYWMPGYADCVAEVMRVLGYKRHAVLGWSLGGHVGIEMVARGDTVSRLMISGSPPFARTQASVDKGFRQNDHMHLAAQRDLSLEEVSAYARATCGSNAPYEPFLEAAVARTDGRARELMFSRIVAPGTTDNREVVSSSPVTLAVVNGEDDPFVDNDFVDAVPYANLWNGRTHQLKGIGHAPFWEAPEKFDPLLCRFLAEDVRSTPMNCQVW